MRNSGLWDTVPVKRVEIPKNDPRQLRMRAHELKLKGERFIEEADKLERQAEELEENLKK